MYHCINLPVRIRVETRTEVPRVITVKPLVGRSHQVVLGVLLSVSKSSRARHGQSADVPCRCVGAVPSDSNSNIGDLCSLQIMNYLR